MQQQRSIFAAAAIVLGLAGMPSTGAAFPGPQSVRVSTAATPAQPPQAVTQSVGGMATATDFSGIVDRYGPAVVNISVVAKTMPTQGPGQEGLDPDDPFHEFFRRFGPQMPRMPRSPLLRGQGSGFIVSADGLILTNAHVVDGAQEVTVRLTDRREFRAKVLGADRKTDIAVIRIDAKNLPTVKLGDPGAIKVGEPVLAIGSPYGFENSATAGIVSAKSRSLPDGDIVPFIQTDVAVNPGNSGGPLFNIRGEVIGINSQIYSRSGGYMGISFAIPIDVAVKVQEQLVKHGKVTRGRLGISIQSVNQALADSFGLKKVQGALVASVEDGSPADKAGIETGDVIIRFNGREINSSSELPGAVAATAPGTSARVELIRKGSPKVINVTVGELKDGTAARRSDNDEDNGRLGLAVRPLTKEEQRRANINGGLLVEDVSGPARVAGIRPGDVILTLNGTAVTSGEQLRSMAQKAGKSVALLIQRGGAKVFVPIEMN